LDLTEHLEEYRTATKRQGRRLVHPRLCRGRCINTLMPGNTDKLTPLAQKPWQGMTD
jgi:hypothetical protein